jgi:hypothetical protein
MCLDFLYNFCLKHFLFQEELSEIWLKMYIVLRVKYPLLLSWNMNSLDRFLKNTQMLNFMKIRPVGSDLLHVDGRTDRQTDRHDEANSRFSQFCEHP